MSKIKKVKAREILNARSIPTLEVLVELENGILEKASVPSGASTGEREAFELRDNDSRLNGLGVKSAVFNVEEKINELICGLEPLPDLIDDYMLELDGTENKTQLGANAILAVSIATARAGAKDKGLPLYKFIREVYNLPDLGFYLPTPLFNVINGGVHADSGLDVQEHTLIPIGPKTFAKKLEMGVKSFWSLKKVLQANNFNTGVGYEGGFAPKLGNTLKVFDALIKSLDLAEINIGEDISFGLDVAASELYNAKTKKYKFEGKKRNSKEMLEIYYKWINKYPISLIEDPFDEDDWGAWVEFTQKMKKIDKDFLIVGDDLFTTNTKRLILGLEKGAANSILIKPNQIGTISETIDCIKMAKENDFEFVISHRSGETNDSFIADLSVATNAPYIKAGAPNRGERVAKYNRLLEIENKLNKGN